MKFPFKMLLDYVQTTMTPQEVGDLLTMTGFELEEIEEVEGDSVLDISICSNRGDGLSVFGLAREVLAKAADAKPTELFERATRRFYREDESTKSNFGFDVELESSACDRFAYRAFENVLNGPASDLIATRLRQAGQRNISLFVDLTNYVMLELGQPLHAYDADKLQGKTIIVREANHGEKITTLNGQEHELRSDQLMICDARGPIGVAGVMGGAETECDENTRRVLLESAHFHAVSVRRTRKQLGLNTDASYRFERSVDPEGVVSALNRFAELLSDLGFGETIVPGVYDRWNKLPSHKTISLRLSKAQTLLGMEVSESEARSYLTKLGFELAGSGDVWQVTPPSWRFDIKREEDLVEELGRIHGYEKIPAILPEGVTSEGGVFGKYQSEEILVEAALRAGFDQIMTSSLRGEGGLDDPRQETIKLRSPSSPDTTSLRNSLLPGIADVIRKVGLGGAQVFELGPIFRQDESPLQTKKSLALGAVGAVNPISRQGESATTADFFSLKSALDYIASALGGNLTYTSSDEDARFQPGRQAVVHGAGMSGVIGQIHPLLADRLQLPVGTVFAELLLTEIAEHQGHRFKPLSRNPSVRRDIAFLLDKSIPFAQVESLIHSAIPETLENVWLFDVYEGTGVPQGKHSLAVALTLRKSGSNFTDEEANQEREKVVSALAQLGATTR